MTAEIFIENQRLDLTEDISSLLTFALDDVKDFASRNTTFSKTIVLPGTARNNLLFGHIFDARVSNPYDSTQKNVTTNFNASVSADCLMFQNHIQTFKGTIRLLEIIIDKGVPEYEVAVFGELGGLVAKMAALKLEDLDFSAYDHNWTHGNITASWDAAPGAGYFYPLIDYGTVSPANDKVDYDIRAFRPALYVRQYIDKIITNAGYKWQSDLFDTTRFKRLVIPHNRKSLQSLTNLIARGFHVGSQEIISNIIGPIANIPQSTASGTDFTYSAGVWTYTGVATKTFTLYVSAQGTALMLNGSIRLGIKRNGSIVGYLAGSITSLNATWSIIENNTITLDQNDTISIFAQRQSGGSGNYTLSTTNFMLQFLSPVPVVADTFPGGAVTMNDTIPRNYLQKDFLSSIVKLFNLYIYEDNYETETVTRKIPKMLYIKPYVDFYDLNVSGITDWTYKVDRTRTIRLKPMSEINYRYYNFKFKSDSDFWADLYRTRYNEGYGDRVYDSGYEFSNEKKDIDVIFSGSVLVGYAGKDKIVSVMYKRNAGVEERMDTNIRLLQTKKITGKATWKIKDGNSILVSGLTTYGYGGHYDDPDAPANDIQWGVPKELFFTLVSGAINVTQFNVYWSSYMAEITDKDSKLMTAWFKLSSKDIYDLDFSKFIHVDGSIWRLNKIEDWNATEPDVCKAELLKTINQIY